MSVLIGMAGMTRDGEAADKNNPIVYAPDVVGIDRMFLVGLRVAADAPDVEVSAAESVVLFDRTRPPYKTDVRRFYFRAVKPSARAEIRFRLTGGEVVVPVEIWSFDDLRRFRKLKGVQLPRRWPLGQPLPELKTRQVFPIGKPKGGEGAPKWLAVPDDVLWNMQPDTTIPRFHWTNLQFGCPVHGKEIYKKRSYYPWKMNATPPFDWKIRCPVGGEQYPSNDFARGDMTSGEFPDDGMGGGCLHDGRKYGFVAELSQRYCRAMMSMAPLYSKSYVDTGDARYVHKTLVALCRLAVEYAYLATMTQHRHRNSIAQVKRFGQGLFSEGPCLVGSGFTTYSIDQPDQQAANALAYDRIFPAIKQDSEIIPFLRKKGYAIRNHEDVRRFIEENLFAVWMQGTMDGACACNEPRAQRAFAKMAEVLNYRRGTDFMDFLYFGSQRRFSPMRVFLSNNYFRDGAPCEATGGYNGYYVAGLGPVVESIEHLRTMRPEVYPESKYPTLGKSRRYHNVFDFSMDTVTIDRSYPSVGDDGNFTDVPRFKKLPVRTWQNGGAAAFEHAYRTFQDLKFAWALAREPSWRPSADFPFTRHSVESEAAWWPDNWNDASSLHDGYGLAILRGGLGAAKRAFWMAYGRCRSHAQDTVMDIGLQGYDGVLLAPLGYPRNWGCWETSWATHHVARQFPYLQMTAQAQLFADAGPVHLAEVRGQSVVQLVPDGKGYELPPDNWQRRMIVLVDAGADQPGPNSGNDFYGVDLYRVSGGEEHWWAFHCLEGDFTVQGIELSRQEGGTLAGPDVPYGDPKWLKDNGCTHSSNGWSGVKFAFPHLYHVEKGTAAGVWSADWKLKGGDGLHLRLTVASADGAEANICDGKPPAGGPPYEMKWVMLHNRGKTPLKTQFLSLIETYRNAPIIREVRPLKLSGDDESGFAAAGCVVRLANRTDTILASADPIVNRVASVDDHPTDETPANGSNKEISFAGRFGFLSEEKGVPVSMVLVGGTKLAKGPFGIVLKSPEYWGRITRIDRAAETIVVSPAPPVPEALVGNYVFITNSVRRIAYKVREVSKVAGGARFSLVGDSLIGTGRVAGVENYRVRTETPFVLNGYRYYHGARLTNAARTAEYQIIDVRSQKAAFIDPEVHPDARTYKLAGQFRKDEWFHVYDYGVGDHVVFPHRATAQRTGPNKYTVSATEKVAISLPTGYYWEPAALP